MDGPRNRQVTAVAYDGLCTFEFGVAVELFGLARPELDVDWYRFAVVSVDPGPIGTLAGVQLTAPTDLEQVRTAGTVVLPGWRDPTERPPEDLLNAIVIAHERGARVLSICSGVFVLAATGLLDGRAATTHWRYTDLLRSMYPGIDVQPDVLYVDNGSTLTSAGSAAGLDLGLHLIRRDYCAGVANSVARRLVVPPHR
ncbi:MAG: DJ-1/PfpI family protein, partial [Actinomycetota bacterium]